MSSQCECMMCNVALDHGQVPFLIFCKVPCFTLWCSVLPNFLSFVFSLFSGTGPHFVQVGLGLTA